jgi:hypothetical protein
MTTEAIQAVKEVGVQIVKEGLKQLGKETLNQTGKKVLIRGALLGGFRLKIEFEGALSTQIGEQGAVLAAASQELGYQLVQDNISSEAVLIGANMAREITQCANGNLLGNEVAINVVKSTASATGSAIGGVMDQARIPIVSGLIGAAIGAAVGTIAVAALVNRVRGNEL